MSQRRWLSISVVAVVAACAFLTLGYESGTAGGVTAGTVYSRTVYGLDFRSLDFRLTAQFISNSGGGVYVQDTTAGAGPSTAYLEAGIDLPVGANVTSVSFFYKDCVTAVPAAGYYFGSYSPSTGQFVYVLPIDAGGSGDCAQRYVFTRAKQTITTVQANRRYVLGTVAFVQGTGTEPIQNPSWLLYGGRVRYTCPTTCT